METITLDSPWFEMVDGNQKPLDTLPIPSIAYGGPLQAGQLLEVRHATDNACEPFVIIVIRLIEDPENVMVPEGEGRSRMLSFPFFIVNHDEGREMIIKVVKHPMSALIQYQKKHGVKIVPSPVMHFR